MLDGEPLFFMEEYEDSVPMDGENIEEVQVKTVRRRKVLYIYIFLF